MKRASTLITLVAVGALVGGCGLIGDLTDDIKQSLSQIKAAASGDIGAANTAIEGSSVAVQSAFSEVGASLDVADTGGAGKVGLSTKTVLNTLQDSGDIDYDGTVEADCDLGGTITRQITINISRENERGTAKITTNADNCELDLSSNSSTNETEKSSFFPAQADGDTVALLDGDQTIDLDINLTFSEEGEPQPTSVNSIGFSSGSWIQEVTVDGAVESLLEYTDFSMTGQATNDGETLDLELDGNMSVDRAPLGFDVAYDNLAISLAQSGLSGSILADNGDDDASLETTIDGGIALSIRNGEDICVESTYTFETISPLVINESAPCPGSGELTVTEETEEGETTVTYTFVGNNEVSFSGSDGEGTFPCNNLGGDAASCLTGIEFE